MPSLTEIDLCFFYPILVEISAPALFFPFLETGCPGNLFLNTVPVFFLVVYGFKCLKFVIFWKKVGLLVVE